MDGEELSPKEIWRATPLLIKALSIIVGLTMGAIMTITFVDVVGRYLLGLPVPGGFEIIEFIMGTMVFSAFPIVAHENAHITVGLFDHAFRGVVRRIQQTFVHLFSAGALAFISWRLYETAVYFDNDGRVGIQLNVKIAPVIYGMAGLSFLAFLLVLALIWDYLRTGVERVASGSLD